MKNSIFNIAGIAQRQSNCLVNSRSLVQFQLSAVQKQIKNKMINRILKFKNLYKLLIFIPLIFYFGKRSYIAFDEGFYALQARWILDKGNWIIPLWWDEYVLDRTIGLQFLIAKSQEIFGRNIFFAYLPTTAAAILMLFVTYKLHEEFFNKKYAIISPLILSTSYLWFDYSHLATQDIICLLYTSPSPRDQA